VQQTIRKTLDVTLHLRYQWLEEAYHHRVTSGLTYVVC